MAKKKDYLVQKANALIRMRWKVENIWEPRLVALLTSKIRMEDEDFKTHEIPISELLQETGKKRGGKTYKEIADAAEKIMSRVGRIEEPDGTITLFHMFSLCKIKPETGVVQLHFEPFLKPFYLQLKERYTQYSLEEFMQLPSIYSQRVFEILMSWRNVPDGEVTISMDELHKQLDTPQSFKKDFKAFRLRVLDQAQKDIMRNPDSSLDYEWQAVNKGRKVIAVRFIFDKGRIEKERREKEEEAQRRQSKRNNELYIAANKCSKSMVTVPASEQDMVQREQKQEVCDMCQSQKMLQPLFPLECRRYKRVEIVE